jgi:hypothetical protein
MDQPTTPVLTFQQRFDALNQECRTRIRRLCCLSREQNKTTNHNSFIMPHGKSLALFNQATYMAWLDTFNYEVVTPTHRYTLHDLEGRDLYKLLTWLEGQVQEEE